jgi:type II secretory pathway pseudopilin PulG
MIIPDRKKISRQLAFTMAEVMVGVSLMGILFVALFGGMSSGFALTQVARENLRATQIILERVEGVRLYNWNQLCYSNWIPSTFTNYYYPITRPGESKGIEYVGTMTISPAVMDPPASYSGNMRQVTVNIQWVSAGVPRSRTITTYVARNGIQNYVYGPNFR